MALPEAQNTVYVWKVEFSQRKGEVMTFVYHKWISVQICRGIFTAQSKFRPFVGYILQPYCYAPNILDGRR